MANAAPYETILKLCAQADGQPWYPSEFAKSLGIDQRKLQGPIDDLIHAGLIEMTEWQSGREQGYRLTGEGKTIVDSPRELARLSGSEQSRSARQFDEPETDRPAPPDRGNAVRASHGNAALPSITYLLLAANVGIFLIAMWLAVRGQRRGMQGFVMMGDAEARHQTGGLTAADLLHGDWWRLLTTIFVHRDIFHLLINLSTFMSFGPRAEQLWGRWRFLAIYLCAGLGSVCVILWNDPIAANDASKAPMGASGSLCGILLAAAVWYVMNRAQLPRQVVRAGLRQVLMAFIWWMVWMALIGWLRGMKFWWLGHIAGAGIGLIVAVFMNLHRYNVTPMRWLFLMMVPLVPAACVGLVRQSKASDPAWKKIAREVEQGEDARGKRLEKKDQDDFQKEWAPKIEKERESADRLLGLMKEWLGDGRPAQFPPQDVRDEIDELRQKFSDLDDQVNRLPQPETDAGRKSRLKGQKCAEKYARLLVLLAKKTQPDARWTDDDKDSLEKAIERKNDARKAWLDTVKKPGASG